MERSVLLVYPKEARRKRKELLNDFNSKGVANILNCRFKGLTLRSTFHKKHWRLFYLYFKSKCVLNIFYSNLRYKNYLDMFNNKLDIPIEGLKYKIDNMKMAKVGENS